MQNISIIMPVYNAERHLRQAIESILNQTYYNFEFIIIDDGSTDHSLKIIKELAIKDDRIKVITRENRGLVYSLNEGIYRAQGEYIARMDADDISYPERLKKEMDMFLHDSKLYLVGTNFRNIYEPNVNEETRKLKQHFEKNVNEPVSDDEWRMDIFEDYKVLHATWLVKRELFDKMGLYKEYMAEDVEFLFRTACSNYKIAKIQEVLFDYRIDGNAKSAIEGITLENKRQICSFKLEYVEKCLREKIKNIRYLIWGADISGKILCDIMQDKYPKSECIAYIDSFKTGKFNQRKVILPEDISKQEYNYIFICTNGGRKAAIEHMKKLDKKVIEDYFKVV